MPKIVAETLRPLKNKKLDTLIFGLYSFIALLRSLIQERDGGQIQLIDSGAETVGEVSMLLDYFAIANTSQMTQEPEYFFFIRQVQQNYLMKLRTNG